MLNGRNTVYSDEVIESNGFWGNIAIKEFQQQRAIPLQIPLELIKSSLISTMQTLEIELGDVVEKYKAQGINSVDDVAGTKINGENAVKTLYKKALFAQAKHDILPEFETIASRDLHEKRTDISEQKQLLTESVQAIRTLKGKRRGTVWSI
ncbi:head completion/stabilization protein [Pasteurella skyensis]|uniref:Head completion/stabilization protein n=1 Tax=Phocoenobacter skyensis TaxID=97481 RepID=A0AAJ6P1H1_9PAST|nr:head completion/stabilization protein [Pasteurella skyensis]MDP8173674.1 head completion/stabilization protein [Pasteurella skyensis]MDP8178042.1 head completion/stabilization protein [Pasteurella skyensis]